MAGIHPLHSINKYVNFASVVHAIDIAYPHHAGNRNRNRNLLVRHTCSAIAIERLLWLLGGGLCLE